VLLSRVLECGAKRAGTVLQYPADDFWHDSPDVRDWALALAPSSSCWTADEAKRTAS
jgi:hypothetical protein